jgi:hypothetical protein
MLESSSHCLIHRLSQELFGVLKKTSISGLKSSNVFGCPEHCPKPMMPWMLNYHCCSIG